MVRVPDARFALRRVSETDWVIHDLLYLDDDYRRTVCCVTELADGEVEVLWMRDLPLGVRHSSAYKVMEAVQALHESSRATRPIPIPRRPPLRHRERTS